MTRAEIEQKIDTIETKAFYLKMKDRWTLRDYDLDTKYTNELRELYKALKEC